MAVEGLKTGRMSPIFRPSRPDFEPHSIPLPHKFPGMALAFR